MNFSLKNMFRADSWTNFLKAVGTDDDATTSTFFAAGRRLTDQELRAMYSRNGLIARCIDIGVRDMTRRGFKVVGDTEGKTNAHFEEHGFHVGRRSAVRWAHAIGGSVVVFGVNDGITDTSQPLNESNIQTFDWIRVFDRTRVTWTSQDLYDQNSPKFGEPKFLTINTLSGKQLRFHESRVHVMDGLPVDDQTRIDNNYWGDSWTQRIYEEVKSLGMANTSVNSILEDFVQVVFSIKGLMQMIRDGEYDEIKKRLQLMKLTKHSLNGIALDADLEQYIKSASSVAGLADLLDRIVGMVSTVRGMPQTILFGRSAAGMNATGEGDRIAWYDQVDSDRQEFLHPLDEKLVRLTMLAKKGPFKGVQPENWKVEYLPLWSPSEKEIAETYDRLSQADTRYYGIGSLSREEIRTRFKGDRFGDLEVKNTETLPELPPPKTATAPPKTTEPAAATP